MLLDHFQALWRQIVPTVTLEAEFQQFSYLFSALAVYVRLYRSEKVVVDVWQQRVGVFLQAVRRRPAVGSGEIE